LSLITDNPPLFRTLLRQLNQLPENRSSKARHSIPPFSNREASGATAAIVTGQDIGEGFVALRVEPGVQEAEGRMAVREHRIVDERHDAGHERARGGCAGDDADGAVPGVLEVQALGGDIGLRFEGQVNVSIS
jgi:hypothetical protein